MITFLEIKSAFDACNRAVIIIIIIYKDYVTTGAYSEQSYIHMAHFHKVEVVVVTFDKILKRVHVTQGVLCCF